MSCSSWQIYSFWGITLWTCSSISISPALELPPSGTAPLSSLSCQQLGKSYLLCSPLPIYLVSASRAPQDGPSKDPESSMPQKECKRSHYMDTVKRSLHVAPATTFWVLLPRLLPGICPPIFSAHSVHLPWGMALTLFKLLYLQSSLSPAPRPIAPWTSPLQLLKYPLLYNNLPMSSSPWRISPSAQISPYSTEAEANPSFCLLSQLVINKHLLSSYYVPGLRKNFLNKNNKKEKNHEGKNW